MSLNESESRGVALGIATTVALPFVIAAMVAVTFPFMLLKAWVATKLWGWFVVKQWPDCPTPSLMLMVGLLYLHSHVVAKYTDKVEKQLWKGLLTSAAASLVALLIGWIVSLFV